MPNLGSSEQNKESLKRSRLIRIGLPSGTVAPDFRLPLVGGGELSLAEFRGQRILLVFSDPNCGPCNELAPWLEQFHHRVINMRVVMISRGDPNANRVKACEHGLTFPIALQNRWEISRAYGMFATPIAFLIDEQGLIAADVVIGGDAIMALAAGDGQITSDKVLARLDELRRLFEMGNSELEKIENQRRIICDSLTKIRDAIQLLEKLLGASNSTP